MGLQSISNWLIVTQAICSPSIIVGLINTLEVLQLEKFLKYRIEQEYMAEKLLDWSDVIVFSRVMNKELIPFFNEGKKKGKKIIYYADDCLYDIPENAIVFRRYSSQMSQSTLAYFVKNANVVATCSPWLAKSYEEKYECRTAWIQPAVKLMIANKTTDSKDKMRIGFAGSTDYLFFLEQIKDVLISLYHKHKKEIQFEFFGPKPDFRYAIDAICYPIMCYPHYERLLAERNWDIGFAYIKESRFTNNKMFNKYLEYSRFGIAGIYSDTELYRRIVRNHENGILAQDTAEDWYNQFEVLFNEPQTRNRISQNAQDEIKEKFSPQKSADLFKSHLKEYF